MDRRTNATRLRGTLSATRHLVSSLSEPEMYRELTNKQKGSEVEH